MTYVLVALGSLVIGAGVAVLGLMIFFATNLNW